jgi:hypothetical protein
MTTTLVEPKARGLAAALQYLKEWEGPEFTIADALELYVVDEDELYLTGKICTSANSAAGALLIGCPAAVRADARSPSMNGNTTPGSRASTVTPAGGRYECQDNAGV